VEWNGIDLRILSRLRRAGPALRILVAFGAAREIVDVSACWRAASVGCASLEKLRIAEAIPVYGIDIVERDLPQETSQMRALHFNKAATWARRLWERIRSRGSGAQTICGLWS